MKSLNILVDENLKGKLSDFGLSFLKSSKSLECGGGSPLWMAPEMFKKGASANESTDIYALGVTMMELWTRRTPYWELTEECQTPLDEIIRRIREENLRPSDPPRARSNGEGAFGGSGQADSLDVPQDLLDLAHECMMSNPKRRPDLTEIESRISAVAEKLAPGLAAGGGRGNSQQARLLHDILPPKVARALLDGRKVEPETFEPVTIFFSDVVNFTRLSRDLPPEKVMSFLDRMYSAFDALARTYGLFKVETIGDAYMCVGGLPDPQADHTLRVARFALEARRAASKVHIDPQDPGKGTLKIRVGFHTGSVVASVVGKRNPRYCLFGDTVNTASRMESSSERSRIHMSGAAAERMRSQAPWAKMESRGVQNIKGKGEMHTYWLLSTKKPAKLAGSGVKFAEGDEQDHAAAAAAGEESKDGKGKQDDEGKRRASAVSIAAQQIMEEMRSKTGSHTSLASLVDSGRNRSIRDSIAGFLFKKKPGHTHFADSTNASARFSLSAAHLTHNLAHEQQQHHQQQEKEQEKKQQQQQQQQQRIRADSSNSSNSSTHDGVEDSEMLDFSPPSSTANQPMHHAAVNIDAPSGGHLLSKQDAAVLHLEDGEDEGEDGPIDV